MILDDLLNVMDKIDSSEMKDEDRDYCNGIILNAYGMIAGVIYGTDASVVSKHECRF
jgi:hypothetical protein